MMFLNKKTLNRTFERLGLDTDDTNVRNEFPND